MSDTDTVAKTAQHILYILIEEQRLRPGEGISPLTLEHDLNRHQVPAELQQDALEYAMEHDWLQKGPYGEWQLTEHGLSAY